MEPSLRPKILGKLLHFIGCTQLISHNLYFELCALNFFLKCYTKKKKGLKF